MKPMLAKTVLAAAVTFAAVLSMSAAHAARMPDPYTDGARSGKVDTFTDGARMGKVDPFTDGARSIAGMDRSGVSSDPARAFDPDADRTRLHRPDPYTDGGRKVAGMDRSGVSSDPARKFDTYTDGAHA